MRDAGNAIVQAARSAAAGHAAIGSQLLSSVL